MNIKTISTQPFQDQKPGTSGLRKKVCVFQQQHYLENFVQSILNTLNPAGKTFVLGGDGRFFNLSAMQIILKICAANQVAKVIVGQQGLLSTPALSHLIRKYETDGGFMLSASHNPGGADGDFGLKFNQANGGPAVAALTDQFFAVSQTLTSYRIAEVPEVDLAPLGRTTCAGMVIEVVDSVADYAVLMSHLFDFDKIKHLFHSGVFHICFDAMHAITGPYAKQLLEKTFGAAPGSVIHARPKADFGGAHPDPNPAHTPILSAKMNTPNGPNLGAASDGDGDRNMILGRNFYVSPSDSLAVLAANAHLVPGYARGLTGVARSMPTSQALDLVAERLGIECYETPTGWKFFGNLLDAGKITLCGEESFGTGSDHVREKDGLWAVLFWLNLLAVRGESVEQMVRAHWQRFGRHYYTRHDYEAIPSETADVLVTQLRAKLPQLAGQTIAGLHIVSCDDFAYTDSTDQSQTNHQGIRLLIEGGSRVVFRLSGTGTQGATLRVYLERYEANRDALDIEVQTALKGLRALAEAVANITALTGKQQPDVIT